jgi:hydrogenase maturation protein HypF
MELAGFVRNMPGGLNIELEGRQDKIDLFFEKLSSNPPAEARIDNIDIKQISIKNEHTFQIMESGHEGDSRVSIPPDLATCEQCQRELFDPDDRRYRYPFVNCTDCGPRFTIVKSLPYDRERTSMAEFLLCKECAHEYNNPNDRRFDAQPNACADCGPALWCIDSKGARYSGDPVRIAVKLLKQGKIVAVKGLGGYHLSCNALDDEAVARLRVRKRRPHKAFAILCSTIEQAKKYCECSPKMEKDLLSASRPVVICGRRYGDQSVARSVSPDTNDLGVMLAYTPLHHLLLDEVKVPLVMTSANKNDEPIVTNEDELKTLLGVIADAALVHNRPIVRRCDDSVLTRVDGKRLFFRRSRGFVPDSLTLPFSGPPVLGCGAEQKVVGCVTRDDQAYLTQHIGDVSSYEVYEFYNNAMKDICELLKIKPEIAAYDMHPGYHTAEFGKNQEIRRVYAVQHHHAHIAACMAENGLKSRVIGIALDGTGYGPDLTVWGGEFLIADLCEYKRIGHFKQYPMPGGDAAVREPLRMALSYAGFDSGIDIDTLPAFLVEKIGKDDAAAMLAAIRKGVNSPMTSSCGRLCDAVAALCGICLHPSYDGQAPLRLQHICALKEKGRYPFEITSSNTENYILDFSKMITSIIGEVNTGCGVDLISARFHNTLIEGVAAMCEKISAITGIKDAVLSGGVFQNRIILGKLRELLKNKGICVYIHKQLPPNDACIAYGQAAVALARYNRECC